MLILYPLLVLNANLTGPVVEAIVLIHVDLRVDDLNNGLVQIAIPCRLLRVRLIEIDLEIAAELCGLVRTWNEGALVHISILLFGLSQNVFGLL